MKKFDNLGIKPADILLPKAGTDMHKWAVVACDQFTSQPEYWEEVERIAGDAPSTLRLILPESKLESDGVDQEIEKIHKTMDDYLANDRLRSMDEGEFAALPDCGEGLSRRIYRAVRRGRTLEEVYGLAKTKRYAHARIRRAALWAALGLRAADRPDRPSYLRVLGASGTGRVLLREMKGRAALPVLTKPAHGRGVPLLELEARCTDLYGLCRRTVPPCGLEWTASPVILP